MTALVGVFGAGAAAAGASLAAMLDRMRNRGTAIPEQYAAPGVFISSRRHAWEVDEHGWRGPVLTVKDDWVVAADASLYYVADLQRKLSRQQPIAKDAPSGDLVVAALRAWGDRFADHLEGDFAILAYHRPSGRVLLAREFAGKRALALTVTSDRTLVAASAARAVIEFPGVSREYDLDFIAASISGIDGHGNRTAFASVPVVPGGTTLAFDAGQLSLVQRWTPPAFSSDWAPETSDRAADQLRGLLEDAVLERMPADGTTAVFMSGGWDSTSVYAAGRSALDRRGVRSVTLRPISMRYPEGDTGNETAFIESIARRWSTDVHWISVDDMPLFEDAVQHAAVRDDPRVHPFESQVRALCRAGRDLGLRIAQDGAGGDHLFMVSGVAIMADHFRAGRFDQLWTAWRAWGNRMVHTFARSCILPQLSPGTLSWISSVRGRPLRGFWDSELAPWVRITPGLLREMRPELERNPDEGISAFETRKALTTPLVARALAWIHAIALEEGVVVRSPFFDRRVITFAASRPLNERHGGPDSKVLLRRAMRELLPSEVLAPRGRKTGTPVGYFKREMQASVVTEFQRVLGGRRSQLEMLGLIDPVRLRAAVDQYATDGNHAIGALLQLTLEAERWLAVQDIRE